MLKIIFLESCDRVLSSMNSGSGGPSDLIDGSGGVQPLMSNVLGGNVAGNKQSNTAGGNMDAQQQQYMQQQSQIFVFSTSLANKSAESVIAGQYPTIIAYHCAQPRTKKFLEVWYNLSISTYKHMCEHIRQSFCFY